MKGIRVHLKKVVALYRGDETSEWTACGRLLNHHDCQVAITINPALVDCKLCLRAMGKDICPICKIPRPCCCGGPLPLRSNQ